MQVHRLGDPHVRGHDVACFISYTRVYIYIYIYVYIHILYIYIYIYMEGGIAQTRWGVADGRACTNLALSRESHNILYFYGQQQNH